MGGEKEKQRDKSLKIKKKKKALGQQKYRCIHLHMRVKKQKSYMVKQSPTPKSTIRKKEGIKQKHLYFHQLIICQPKLWGKMVLWMLIDIILKKTIHHICFY